MTLTDNRTDVAGNKSLFYLYFILAMNRDIYATLPDDLRAVIDANSGAETLAWVGRAHDNGDTKGRDLMATAGT